MFPHPFLYSSGGISGFATIIVQWKFLTSFWKRVKVVQEYDDQEWLALAFTVSQVDILERRTFI